MNRRNAFTMVELIFVIVVMAILAKFGVELYLQIYNNYSNTIDTTDKEEKTQTLIEEIANRLRERIPESTQLIANGIRWVGRDTDGWNNGTWSGVADIGHETDSNKTLIESPGTDMTVFNGSGGKYALFFKQNDAMGNSLFYTLNGVMYPISTSDTTGTRNAFILSRSIWKGSEHYIVSEFAYSIVYNSGAKTLTLSTFKPWTNTAPVNYLMADGISNFSIMNFKGNAGGFIIKLCMEHSNFTGERNASVCKQKFVF